MWYAVVINTDAEKAFRIHSTREQVVFGRAGRKILPARPKTTCSRNLKGEENLPVLCREGDEHRLRGTEEAHRREP